MNPPPVKPCETKPYIVDPLELNKPSWLIRSPNDIVNKPGKRYLIVR